MVTARDFTHDPRNGCDAQKVADSIVASRDPRVKYIIWNRQICNSKTQPWTWRRYTGANPHNKHVHISLLPEKAKYDSRADWQLTQTQLERMAMAFAARTIEDIEVAWGKKVSAPFKHKVVEISAELDTSIPTISWRPWRSRARAPSAPISKNPYSGAVGLIQFMPGTARGLGSRRPP